MLGGDQRRMSMDLNPPSQLSINSKTMYVSQPSALANAGMNSPYMGSREATQNEMQSHWPESVADKSKKLQDDLQELGLRIKHHEENVKYLKTSKNKLEDSITQLQVTLQEYNNSKIEDPADVKSEEETIGNILKHENSAAAILCMIKSLAEALPSDHPIMKDVVGVVATLGKVHDDNLSRLLSEYLGLETMLAVVCKTYEGVKALEAYKKDGLIDKNFGLHALAASTGKLLPDRFLVICLENLRPYAGEFVENDPQRRLDLLNPRLANGDTPPGFLGFAVNMITIDYTNLYCISKNGYTLRETLFYNLFSNLQVYRSRGDMLNALSCIKDGAISLDGGIIRRPGMFSLGDPREDMDIKFPNGSERLNLPERYFQVENQLKETKWKRDRTCDDMQREQSLLNHAKFNYETKKQEFVQFIAQCSSQVPQHPVGRVKSQMSFH